MCFYKMVYGYQFWVSGSRNYRKPIALYTTSIDCIFQQSGSLSDQIHITLLQLVISLLQTASHQQTPNSQHVPMMEQYVSLISCDATKNVY